MSFEIDDLTSVIAHWNVSDVTGLSDGDYCDSLPDSISSWDLEASGEEDAPVYRPSSSINSKPALEFDGYYAWLTTASKALSGIDNASWAAVFNMDTLKNYNTLFHLNKSSGTPTYNSTNMVIEGQGYASGLVLLAHRDTTTTYGYMQSATSAFSASTSYILSAIHGKGMVGFRKNGTYATHTGASSTTVSYANPNATVYASWGASSLGNFDGLLAELVFWDETELNEHYWIEGVLADEYNISLPSWHPFSSAAPTTAPGAGGGIQIARGMQGGMRG